MAARVLLVASCLLVPTHQLIVPRKQTTKHGKAQYAAIRAPFDSLSAGKYAECARRAIADGRFDRARASYGYYALTFSRRVEAPTSDTALMILRWALLEQRAANATGARDVFKLGARLLLGEMRKSRAPQAELQKTAATLFTSWGLAEYKNRAALGAHDDERARLTSLALLRHATRLDDSKQPVLQWKQFRDSSTALASTTTTEQPQPREEPAPPEKEKKQKPKPPSGDIRDLPKRGDPDDPFKHNLWKRSMLERYAKFQDDLLAAAKRGDADALERGAENLERRQGKKQIARSTSLVATWALRYANGEPVHSDVRMAVRPPAGGLDEDQKLLETDDPLPCAVGDVVGSVAPRDATTLACKNLPFPAVLKCTYMDERVFILRADDDAIVLFERLP